MTIRFAEDKDLPAVNLLRREVNELHVQGRPETFKPGFSRDLEDYLYEIRKDPAKQIVVAEDGGAVCGFAILHEICRPETPYMVERRYLDIDEFGVAASRRRQGIGTALIAFIRSWTKERGFDRLELNMWEFNREALAFYEAAGFTTYRRYLEIRL